MKYIYLIVCLLYYVQSFTQKPQDCSSAFPICESGTYHFQDLSGHGRQLETFDRLTCFSSKFAETNSTWLKFEVSDPGVLTFVIEPEDSTNDFDFFLFSSSGNCEDFEEVRCMASSDSFTSPSSACLGNTGLDLRSLDYFESTGCKYNDDNFLKYLRAESGEKYYLLINNFDSNEGFSITFGGTAGLRKLDRCAERKFALRITELYPNPTKHFISVKYMAPATQQSDIEILDMKGKRVLHKRVSTFRGANHMTMSTETIHPGSYLLRLSQDGISSTWPLIK